ncbi:MAG: c-type cytochrome [Planctomycetes bacterium]|nr:c-type cytochrome [Planctomycetota bacterium]
MRPSLEISSLWMAFQLAGWSSPASLGAAESPASMESAGPAAEHQPLSAFQQQAALFHQKCARCHTVGRGDRVGPDLRGVTRRRDKEWLVGLILDPETVLESDPVARDLMKQFNGVRMENAGLTRSQAESLLEYIQTASEGPADEDGEPPEAAEEKLHTRISGPDEGFGTPALGLAGLGFLLVLSAFLWRSAGRPAALTVLVLAAGDAYWTLGGHRYHRLPGNHQGYQPVQPILFSHALHAGKLEISCLYCHHGAEKGPVAGVPAVQLCMNCHNVVKKPADAQKPSKELEKLLAVWEARKDAAPRSIEWVRVHRLPDFVFFDHQVHVQNRVQCQECHGPVETMERLRQASDLSMGWCVNCHRHRGGRPPTHWKRAEATLDCTACHL